MMPMTRKSEIMHTVNIIIINIINKIVRKRIVSMCCFLQFIEKLHHIIVYIKLGIKSMRRSFFLILSLSLFFPRLGFFYRSLTNSSKPQQQCSRLLSFFLLIDSNVVVDWCSTSDTSSTLIHICAISFVSKMKKIHVLSLFLSNSLSPLALFNVVAGG